MLGAGRTADLTEKSMELLGILVVVLWALPMYVAMGFDKDPGSTFTGVFLSNSAIAAEIYALSRLLFRSRPGRAILGDPVPPAPDRNVLRGLVRLL